MQAYLRVDERGSWASVFVGDGDGPQLHPAARSLAAALVEAADVAESGRA